MDKSTINKIMAGIVLIVGGLVVVLISTVVLSVAHGVGEYILTSMNSTGILKGVPNYIGQLNLTTVLTFIGVALMVAGAVVVLLALFEVARGAKGLWGGGGAE